jgi:hypothetical protein
MFGEQSVRLVRSGKRGEQCQSEIPGNGINAPQAHRAIQFFDAWSVVLVRDLVQRRPWYIEVHYVKWTAYIGTP